MKPIFCPNCGKKRLDAVEYWIYSDWPETPEKPYHGIGYDVYCKSCEWSGNIEPDEDSEIIKT